VAIDYNRHGKGQKLKSHCSVHYISCWQSGQRRDPNNALLYPSSLGSLLFEGLYRACHLPYFCSWFKTSATLANCNYKVRILYVYLVYFLNVNSKLLFFSSYYDIEQNSVYIKYVLKGCNVMTKNLRSAQQVSSLSQGVYFL
jgi:hypothetical protein